MSFSLFQANLPFHAVFTYLRLLAPESSQSIEDWASAETENIAIGDILFILEVAHSPYGDASKGIGVSEGDKFKATDMIMVFRQDAGYPMGFIISADKYEMQFVETVLTAHAETARKFNKGFYYLMARPTKPLAAQQLAELAEMHKWGNTGSRSEAPRGLGDPAYAFLHNLGAAIEPSSFDQPLEIDTLGYNLFSEDDHSSSSRLPDLRSFLRGVKKDGALTAEHLAQASSSSRAAATDATVETSRIPAPETAKPTQKQGSVGLSALFSDWKPPPIKPITPPSPAGVSSTPTPTPVTIPPPVKATGETQLAVPPVRITGETAQPPAADKPLPAETVPPAPASTGLSSVFSDWKEPTVPPPTSPPVARSSSQKAAAASLSSIFPDWKDPSATDSSSPTSMQPPAVPEAADETRANPGGLSASADVRTNMESAANSGASFKNEDKPESLFADWKDPPPPVVIPPLPQTIVEKLKTNEKPAEEVSVFRDIVADSPPDTGLLDIEPGLLFSDWEEPLNLLTESELPAGPEWHAMNNPEVPPDGGIPAETFGQMAAAIEQVAATVYSDPVSSVEGSADVSSGSLSSVDILAGIFPDTALAGKSASDAEPAGMGVPAAEDSSVSDRAQSGDPGYADASSSSEHSGPDDSTSASLDLHSSEPFESFANQSVLEENQSDSSSPELSLQNSAKYSSSEQQEGYREFDASAVSMDGEPTDDTSMHLQESERAADSGETEFALEQNRGAIEFAGDEPPAEDRVQVLPAGDESTTEGLEKVFAAETVAPPLEPQFDAPGDHAFDPITAYTLRPSEPESDQFTELIGPQGPRLPYAGVPSATLPGALTAGLLDLKLSSGLVAGVSGGLIAKLEQQAQRAGVRMEEKLIEIQERLLKDRIFNLRKLQIKEDASDRNINALKAVLFRKINFASDEVKEEIGSCGENGRNMLLQFAEASAQGIVNERNSLLAEVQNSPAQITPLSINGESLLTHMERVKEQGTTKLQEELHVHMDQMESIEAAHLSIILARLNQLKDRVEQANTIVRNDQQASRDRFINELTAMRSFVLEKLDSLVSELCQRIVQTGASAGLNLSMETDRLCSELLLARIASAKQSLPSLTLSLREQLRNELDRDAETRLADISPLLARSKENIEAMSQEADGITSATGELEKQHLELMLNGLTQFFQEKTHEFKALSDLTTEELSNIDGEISALSNPSSIESEPQIAETRVAILQRLQKIGNDLNDHVNDSLRGQIANMEDRARVLQEDLISSMESDAYSVRKTADTSIAQLREKAEAIKARIKATQDQYIS